MFPWHQFSFIPSWRDRWEWVFFVQRLIFHKYSPIFSWLLFAIYISHFYTVQLRLRTCWWVQKRQTVQWTCTVIHSHYVTGHSSLGVSYPSMRSMFLYDCPEDLETRWGSNDRVSWLYVGISWGCHFLRLQTWLGWGFSVVPFLALLSCFLYEDIAQIQSYHLVLGFITCISVIGVYSPRLQFRTDRAIRHKRNSLSQVRLAFLL